MRFLHVMKNEKFTKGIADFYSRYFANGEHEILYVNTPGEPTLIQPELKVSQEEVYLENGELPKILTLYRRMSQYDHVVMHSLFLVHPVILLFPRLVKNLIWIAWGYDLYNWTGTAAGLKEKMGVAVGNYVRNHCAGFVGISPPDQEHFKKSFPKSRAKVFFAPYCRPSVIEEYGEYENTYTLEQRKNDGKPVRILVGHSAAKSVNHLQVIEDLAHLKDENIQVLMPLSYGDMDYAEAVETKAAEVFGEKAVCLREFMPVKEYFALLDTVDIAVFCATRQIALGNINRLVFRNRKVYLSEDGVMYHHFADKGVPVCKYAQLKDITFQELTEPAYPQDPDKFMEFIRNQIDIEGKVKRWQVVYDTYKEA